MTISLEKQKQFRAIQKFTFCYLCGNSFKQGDEKNRDHIPPECCFAPSDRNFPLILRTHNSCNGEYNLEDEKIGQIISLKHGHVPPKRDRKLQFESIIPGNIPNALTNLNIDNAIWRWVRGFHAALYNEPLPEHLSHRTIQTPFPSVQKIKNGLKLKPIMPQHYRFVERIKLNRAFKNLDRIQCNNKKLTYECVWEQADNNGPWLCIFAIDLYAWKDLGDIHHFPSRGCAGAYVLPSGKVPNLASKGISTKLIVLNYDALDPFGN